MILKIEPEYTERGRVFTSKMKEIMEEAQKKGLSKADIARIARVDPSTIRNWKTGIGSYRIAKYLEEYLNGLESVKSIDQPIALKKDGGQERIAEIARFIAEGERLGFTCTFTFSNEVK